MEREDKAKICKTLGTRMDCITVLTTVTDGETKIVKFTWMRNCDTYIAILQADKIPQIYRAIS